MANAYLKIENPGVAPVESFTLLGASVKSDNDNTIGKFGSGAKYGVLVCLRNNLNPVVFAGNLRLQFGTVPVKVNNGIKSTEFARVQVKYGGKDRHGVQKSATEDLGFVLEYGAADWGSIDLALREFVSNAIDRAIEEGENDYNHQWQKDHNITDANRTDSGIVDTFNADLREYRKAARDFTNVKVEIVNESQVRASTGTTRVFIPLNAEVLTFSENIGRWFLHFSEPESLQTAILPKANRNLSDRKAAVIYRRGVRVREFESSETPSLFDYNLCNLEMDESRKVDDWKVRNAAARALRDSTKENLAILFQSFVSGSNHWENGFDQYGLEGSWDDTPIKIAARQNVWKDAFESVAGEDSVIATAEGGEHAIRKGYKVIKAPEALVKAAGLHGLRTPEKVLTQDDRDGRDIIDPTPDAIAAVDFCWGVIEENGMTNGKQKPTVKVFRKIMTAGSQTLGFHRSGVVYINADIAEGQSQQLIATAMEECVHYTTNATDNSRDFQDYILNLLVKIARK
jgi:hypothetical protein